MNTHSLQFLSSPKFGILPRVYVCLCSYKMCFRTVIVKLFTRILQYLLAEQPRNFVSIPVRCKRLLSKSSRPALGPTKSAVRWGFGVIFSRPEPDHLFSYSAEVKNEWRCTSAFKTSLFKLIYYTDSIYKVYKNKLQNYSCNQFHYIGTYKQVEKSSMTKNRGGNNGSEK